MKRLSALTLGLLTANVVVVAMLGHQWATYRTLEERLLEISPPDVTVPNVASAVTGRTADYGPLVEKAVFHVTREFIPPPDPTQVVKPPPPALQWVAAMLLPQGKSVAYVRRSDGGPSIKLRMGESVEGWSVTRIERRRVVLEQNGEVFELEAPVSAAPGLNQGMANQ